MFSLNYWSLFLVIPCFALFIYFFLKNRKLLPLFVIFVAIAVPKIPVITLSTNYFTGVRVEDLLILAYCLVLLFEKFKFVKEVFKSKIFMFFAFYMAVLFISLLTGVIKEHQYSLFGGVLSYIRRAEYFCFIFAGYDFYRQNKDNFFDIIKKIFVLILIVNLGIGILQFVEFIGVLNQSSYSKMGLAAGFFNGAYELAAFCNLAIALFLFDILKNRNLSFINFISIIISIILIILSKSRVSLIATVVILTLMIFVYSNKKFKIISLVVAPILIISLILVIKSNTVPIFNRFVSLNFDGLLNSIKYYAKNASYEEYMYIINNHIPLNTQVITEGDLSFNMRIFKWFSAIDLFQSYPLFGYGFSATGTLDGNYVKMLCETGIIGLFSFIALLIVALFMKGKNKSNITELTRWLVLTVAIGSIFIDTFEASKIMEPLWFIIGVSLAERYLKMENLFQELKITLGKVSRENNKKNNNLADNQNSGGNYKEKNKKINKNNKSLKNNKKVQKLNKLDIEKENINLMKYIKELRNKNQLNIINKNNILIERNFKFNNQFLLRDFERYFIPNNNQSFLNQKWFYKHYLKEVLKDDNLSQNQKIYLEERYMKEFRLDYFRKQRENKLQNNMQSNSQNKNMSSKKKSNNLTLSNNDNDNDNSFELD